MSIHKLIISACVAASTAGCSGLTGLSASKVPAYRTSGYTQATPVQPPELDQAGTAGGIISLTGKTVGPAGSLEVALELPRSAWGVQALPDGTDRVLITISADKLEAPLRQEIRRSQFIDGKAKMIVTKLPLGETHIGCQVFDAAGTQITNGSATARVVADTIAAVRLNLIVKEATGGLAIAVDTQKQYADSPEVYLPGGSNSDLDGSIEGATKAPAHLRTGKTWIDTGLTVYEGQVVDFRGISKITYTKRIYAVIVSGNRTRIIDVSIRETTRLRMPAHGKLCLTDYTAI